MAQGPTTLTFAPGEISKSAPVVVKGDKVPEGDETVNVHLSNATGTATIDDGDAVVTIHSNE